MYVPASIPVTSPWGANANKLATEISLTILSVASSYIILSAVTMVVPSAAASIMLFEPE